MRLGNFAILRRQAGFPTRKSVAEFFGVTETTIYRWEVGSTETPPYATKLLLYYIDASRDPIKSGTEMITNNLVRRAFRDARVRLQLTQDEVARRANVSGSWVAHLERHGTIPASSHLNSALMGLGPESLSSLQNIPGLGKSIGGLSDEACRHLLAALIALFEMPPPPPT